MKKILIVEDDPFTKKFYNYLLTKFGFLPLYSEDADEIFQKLANEKISLILMDINLTNSFLGDEHIDGVGLSKKIKEKEEYSNIPVILISAYQKKNESRNYFEESLADYYFMKPITDFNGFIATINKYILE